MTTQYSIPPLRELPPGRLAERWQHVLAEIEQQPRTRRWPQRLPHLPLPTTASTGAALAGKRSRVVVAAALLLVSAIAVVIAFVGRPAPADAAILHRALVAIGRGRVLHVVARVEPQASAIDLATGRKISPYEIIEEWYQPGVGLRGRVVKSNAYRPQPLPSLADVPRTYINALGGFTSGYTKTLQSGRAEIAGRGSMGGRDVIWLRFNGKSTSVSGITISREPTYKVAIDASSYRPLYLQQLDNEGKPAAGTAMQLLSVGRVADIPRAAPPPPADDVGQIMAGIDNLGRLSPAQAASFMTRPGLWLGTEFAGLPLALIEGQRYSYGQAAQFSDIKRHWHGLRLIYGSVDEHGEPIEGQPWVELNEQTDPIHGPGNPPLNGTLVMYDAFAGEAQVGGVYIQISARAQSGPDPDVLVSAARSLEPIPRRG